MVDQCMMVAHLVTIFQFNLDFYLLLLYFARVHIRILSTRHLIISSCCHANAGIRCILKCFTDFEMCEKNEVFVCFLSWLYIFWNMGFDERTAIVQLVTFSVWKETVGRRCRCRHHIAWLGVQLWCNVREPNTKSRF